MNEEYSGFSSPLLRAVRSQDVLEVKSLLRYGCNPDGILLHELSINAAGFIRFGPFVSDGTLPDPFLALHSREHALLAIGKSQLSKITVEEIEDRFEDCIARFWSEPVLRSLTQIPHGDAIPAIIEAAQGHSIEIADLLLSAGADVSFWSSNPTELPTVATPSSLAVTTPLHSAIWSRNLGMLRHLLAKGFDPNAMALAAPTRAITPAMATIVQCDPWDQAAYELIRQHSKVDLNIRTPIFGVHLLHFAVATLSSPLLETVAADIVLSNASTTALGHTLLHVACMPLDERYIQLHSRAIYSSIHETRNLSEFDVTTEAEYNNITSNNYVSSRDVLDARNIDYPSTNPTFPATKRYFPRLSDYNPAQTSLVHLLDRHGVAEQSAQDAHGNTALHYLASHRVVNKDLIAWLQSQKHGELAWTQTKNRYGYTAKELLESGESAVESIEGQPFWHDFDSRYHKNGEAEARLRKKIEDMQYDRLQGRR